MDKEKQIFDKYGNYDFSTEIKQDGFNTATTQIEEMAIDIRVALEYGTYRNFDARTKDRILTGYRFYDTAEIFYEQGYQKLRKDSVVLSKTEYQDLKERANKKIDGLELKIGGASGWFPIEFIKRAIERDLDHDRIVLSREEAERFRGQTINIAKVKSQERKETAGKIYKLVDNKLDLYRNSVIGGSLYDSGYQTAIYDIKRIIKEQFGVEIKE